MIHIRDLHTISRYVSQVSARTNLARVLGPTRESFSSILYANDLVPSEITARHDVKHYLMSI
jgi:SH3-like domain-containing protein